MTDKDLQELMNKTHSLQKEHSQAVESLEKEYEKRFGARPSDIDDDFFIDSFYYGANKITVEEMKKAALSLKKRIKPL